MKGRVIIPRMVLGFTLLAYGMLNYYLLSISGPDANVEAGYIGGSIFIVGGIILLGLSYEQ